MFNIKDSWKRLLIIAIYILTDVLIFFFLPVVWCKWNETGISSGIKGYSLFYLLLHREIAVTDFYYLLSSFRLWVIVPFLTFIAGVILGFSKDYNFKLLIVSSCCIAFSCLFICIYDIRVSVTVDNLSSDFLGGVHGMDGGIIFKCVYAFYCIMAITSALLYNKKKIKKRLNF